MQKQFYTREEVIGVIGEVLLSADAVLDIINNENTDYSDEDLLNIAEKGIEHKANGTELIALERIRQVRELGHDYTHDNLYANNQLATAGSYYALTQKDRDELDSIQSGNWPWSKEYYKPTPDDRVRELVKAGALIAAQIDYELNKSKEHEKDTKE